MKWPFRTEDGFDANVGDEIFFITNHWEVKYWKLDKYFKPLKDTKYFKKKFFAQKYVQENKPQPQSTMAEGQQQGEGVVENLRAERNQYREAFENLKSQLLESLSLYNHQTETILKRDAQLSDTINFLDKIDSSSMSDKTWLAEQKNLRKEGKELRERLTGKEIEEVKINYVASGRLTKGNLIIKKL